MRRSTIMIISILAILMLSGSLMGFRATINVDTNADGKAYIEIVEVPSMTVVDRIPLEDKKLIYVNENNVFQSIDLPADRGYTATVYASKKVNPIITVTDTDSKNFHYGTSTFTLTVDLSGNGSIPDDPPAGN